ncbi:MAG TPA: cell division topological specificity factor MinE [Candidatus Baltobacteraceae bacterium]|nr:cell division topological specificity factor MinE [Candidatus Baltobacteraceae bacterium]
MIEFLNKLFGRQTSGATAKERLRLVLMSDHLSLAPDMIEAMKRDLVDVISRYVEVDREKIDVHFENQDNALAMLANIPITGVNRNGGSGGEGGTRDDTHEEPHAEPSDSHPELVEGRPSAVGATANGQRRRKRRKAGGQHNGSAPQTGSPAPAT